MGRPEAAVNSTTRDTHSVRGSVFREREVVCLHGFEGSLAKLLSSSVDPRAQSWVELEDAEGAVLREFSTSPTGVVKRGEGHGGRT